MKRALVVFILASGLLLAASAAYANFGIHGGYVADTDSCAGCHRAHTATSMVEWLDRNNVPRNALLVGPPTDKVYIFCYVCHSDGAPGAAVNVESGLLDTAVSPGGSLDPSSTVNAPLNSGGFSRYIYYKGSPTVPLPVTSRHTYDGTAWPPAWGSGEQQAYQLKMDCVSCHDPHGSSNYRILKDYVNGHDVGGYLYRVPGDPDPDPYPWVISAEVGYPYANDTDPNLGTPAPTDGFRKHRQYTSYRPSYTWARYAKGTNANPGAADSRHGISGWCTACHENYMAKVSVTPNAKATASVVVGDGAVTRPNNNDVDWDANRNETVVAILQNNLTPGATTVNVDDTSEFAPAPGYIQIGTEVMRYTAKTANTFTVVRGQNNTPAVSHAAGEIVYQAYDAGDGLGFVARHRHPVNVPLSAFNGPVPLTYDPFVFAANYPGGTEFVDLPLEHSKAERGVNQRYELTDWLGCLTCHRAHGTSVRMERYANAGLSPKTFPDGWGSWLVPDPSNQTGVPPANEDADGAATPTKGSQLLRADNRGVCERCHNK